jgi:hypothetical protein
MNAMYSSLGLLVGVAFLIAGLVCMLRCAGGPTTMQIVVWSVRLRITTSLPGVIFAVLGLLVIIVTRPD